MFKNLQKMSTDFPAWFDDQLNSIDDDTSVSQTIAKPIVICRCPCCKSENIDDSSTYASNGVYGPGGASWKTFDARSCKDCGILFKPVLGNGI